MIAAIKFLQKELKIVEKRKKGVIDFLKINGQYEKEYRGQINFLKEQEKRISEILSEIHPLSDEHSRNSFHDCIFDLCGKHFFGEELQEKIEEEGVLEDIFDSLPESIQALACEWGASDTVFKDSVHTYFVEKDS